MSTPATQSNSAERWIFKALQHQQGRLRKMLLWQPMQSQPDNQTSTSEWVALKKLEQGLRQVLATVDLDDALRIETIPEANSNLESLCSALENIVNFDILPSNAEIWQRNDYRYPNLTELVKVLESGSWEYNLILMAAAQVGNKTLFKTHPDSNIGELDMIIDKFIDSMPIMYQIPEQKIDPPRKLLQDVDGLEKAREIINYLKIPFEKLLRSLPQPPKCQVGHHVMIQLEDSSIRSRTDIGLFLSKCSTNEWLDTRLESPPSGDERDWVTYSNMCAFTTQFNPDSGTLFLAAKDEYNDMYLFNPILGQDRSTSYDSRKPTKTLSDLLKDHAFVEGQNSPWIETGDLFHKRHKRSLAAKLILGLGRRWGSAYILKPWSADEVYFPTDLNGNCQQDSPYALCVLEDEHEHIKPRLFSNEQLLAKLLMEIELGFLKNISSLAELHSRINNHIKRNLGSIGYIKVVQSVLNFQQNANMLSSRLNGLGNDYPTIARMVIALRLADRISKLPLHEQATGSEFDTRSMPTSATPPITSNEFQVTAIENSNLDFASLQKAIEESNKWFNGFSKLSSVLEMKDSRHNGDLPKTKIAILDTGLDQKYAGKLPPTRYRDFVNPTQQSFQDTASHGTQMYQVLRRVYSQAEIYVGRVFETCEATTITANLMAQAIDYSVNCWNVDIIALPSGFDKDHDMIRKKITGSINKQKPVLLFAAAANYSNMKGIAFPARLQKAFKAIAMFSTTARNKPTPDFHPAPDTSSQFNLAIFGQHVVINQLRRSGTSVSTMIGAGLAGRLLAFSYHPANVSRIPHVEDLRSMQGMSAVLKSMSIHENGYDCILPEKLLDDDLNPGVKNHPEDLIQHVCGRIAKALYN